MPDTATPGLAGPPGHVTKVPLPAALTPGQVIAVHRVAAACAALPPLPATPLADLAERVCGEAVHHLLAVASAALRGDTDHMALSLADVGGEVLRLLGRLTLPGGPHGASRVSIFRMFEPERVAGRPVAAQIHNRLRAAAEMLELLAPDELATGRADMVETLAAVHHQVLEVQRLARLPQPQAGEG